jgi:Mu transposase, C-terminal domain
MGMVTDEQVRRLRKLSNTEKNQEIAASKAGMDPTTARRYLGLGRLPSELKKERPWRTREDPFCEVWDAVQQQIQESPGLEAKTLFEWLQREYPGRFSDGQIRTLQRRIKLWRVTEGPAQEVYFGQKHLPGRLCASDFTHMTELEITLAGQTFEHLVYHFVLTYSNWETGTICYSESLESLSEGWQNAVWELGAVAVEHRTDSLSSAVNNMSNLEEFNRRYEGVMRYYGVKPRHTNPASPNENGDCEQDRRTRLAEEMAVMRELPARRMESAKRERVKVDSGSLIHVERNSYSVNSRLIGARVEARLYLDHVEVWYGQRKVEDLPRLRGRSKHRVDYRHIIEWLVRKPGAFENYRYQGDLFPTSRFRMAYDALKETTPNRSSKEYLKILKLAAEQGEVQVDEALRELLEGRLEIAITVEAIGELLAKLDTITPVTMVEVAPVDLASFDQLCLDMQVRQ